MLYRAMREILVEDGPLDGLFLYRLPPEQRHDVDVAHRPISGIGAQRSFGSRRVYTDSYEAPDGGPAHDGGLQWYHTGVQFQCRGRNPDDPETVEAAANLIRDVLIQYAGTPVVKAGEEIVRCEIATAPRYYGQDDQERVIASLQVEVWHRPAAAA